MSTRSGRRIYGTGAWSGFYWKNDSREKRDAERETAHQLQMHEQMEAMRGAREQERAGRAKQMEVRLSKLSDIEAYLKRMMSVYEVPEDQWVFKLAPQLTGKAYAALETISNDPKSKNETFRELAVRPGKEVDGRM